MIKVSKKNLALDLQGSTAFIQIATTDRGDCCVYIQDTKQSCSVFHLAIGKFRLARTLLRPQVMIHFRLPSSYLLQMLQCTNNSSFPERIDKMRI